ncbi:MAG: NBR1-Ig-like domain-containing protein [Anaerolineae bacterium]|nr:NBR1-Ig-like domain-containing protein [Anaerolineae bacterium]MDK1081526.1 NBR1-Ig-like domain-containing protein [Anaerolineae bacterium]MDK1118309.1 NBR1-Ig-like domain-containing protein [Anaerolineae bacterium]
MRTKKRFNSNLILLTILIGFYLASACAPTPPPTPFVPPKAASQTPSVVDGSTPVIMTSTPVPTPKESPTATPPCTYRLEYVEDITIPDGTVVSPNARVDKQWLVLNNGSCNWDSRYRLKLVGGVDMGAPIEQALFPARSGTQATIHIIFTAPSVPGTYTSAWQAFNPEGAAFGEAVFMEIIVQ